MTEAELAILSIVAEGPIYGHDIQTVIAQRGLRAWTAIGISSLYYVLDKLERQGLLQSSDTQRVESTARRQYRITSAGYGVLQTAVVDLLSTPREHANDFEVGLANLYVLRPSQIRMALTTYRQELASRLASTREHQEQLPTGRTPLHVAAIFDHHAAMLQAELDWIARFIVEWEAQAPPEEPVTPPEPIEVPRMRQVILPHDPDSPHRAPTRLNYPAAGIPSPASEANTALSLPGPSLADTALSHTTPPHLAQPTTAAPDPRPATPSDADDAAESADAVPDSPSDS